MLHITTFTSDIRVTIPPKTSHGPVRRMRITRMVAFGGACLCLRLHLFAGQLVGRVRAHDLSCLYVALFFFICGVVNCFLAENVLRTFEHALVIGFL